MISSDLCLKSSTAFQNQKYPSTTLESSDISCDICVGIDLIEGESVDFEDLFDKILADITIDEVVVSENCVSVASHASMLFPPLFLFPRFSLNKF